MTLGAGPPDPARAATLAAVYAMGGLVVALILHRSAAASVILGILVWAAVYVGWRLLLLMRSDGRRR